MEYFNAPALRKSKLYTLSRTAVMTAVICVLAPLSIPIGPVPISFTNLAIFLALYLLGWKMGTASCITYLLIGMAGIPVFSGFTGGIGKLLGPTGGYIIGFIFMALLAGLMIDKFRSPAAHFLGLLAGTTVCYALGTAWFCFEAHSTLKSALALCVFPFIPADLLKIILAMVFGPKLRERLVQANLLAEDTETHC